MVCRLKVNVTIVDAFVVVVWHMAHVEQSIKIGFACQCDLLGL